MHRTIRLSCVVAGALWALAFILTLSGTIALAADGLYLALVFYSHDMLAIGAAAVMSVKAVIEKQTRTVVNHLKIAQDAEVANLNRRRQ